MAGLKAAVGLALLIAAAPAAGATAARGALLDVPYLAQPPRLCGGAAVSMVLRYWGARDVFPEDFEPLVDAEADGIRGSVLAGAVTTRGWQALVARAQMTARADWLAAEIDRGRPVIALIEDRRDAYHYVVIVGATATDVVYHDPARAPFQTLPRAEFDRVWAAADRWAMVVLPAADRAPAAATAAATAAPAAIMTPLAAALAPASAAGLAEAAASTPCGDLIARHVALARDGRLGEAERGLLAASTLCPNDPRAHFELGGLRFLQQRYREAAALGERSIAAGDAADDGVASGTATAAARWNLVATSRYLFGDLPGALAAWNQIERPRADVVSVEGPERLDHPIAIRLIAIEPRALITPGAFRRAERRLQALPSIKDVSLRYEPAPDGTATVRATLDERSVLPHGWLGWGAVGVNAAFRRELRIPIASPLRQGEMWDIRYRWKENRPRFLVRFAAPAPQPLPGRFGVELLWERQAYEPVDQPLRQSRRRVGLTLDDWATAAVRWQVGVAADRFDDSQYLAVHGLLDTHWLDDHLAASASTGLWRPTNGADAFASADAQLAWRSTTNALEPGWMASTGIYAVQADAPLALWPIAGSGESRGPLLRGHELHDHGIIVSDTFGRRLAFANAEYRHPVFAHRGASAAIAGFLDISRAWRHPFDDALLDTHVDAGAGLRVGMPGDDDQLRLDIGYGLRDGRVKFSAGYIIPWGREQ